MGNRRPGFSALQRAENSSILRAEPQGAARRAFQCSSASRKFLNVSSLYRNVSVISMFQCSSASRKFLNIAGGVLVVAEDATFQCSSASRKFLNSRCCADCSRWALVSVLFSEPKIPQSTTQRVCGSSAANSFSALQRAENSSIDAARGASLCLASVSVLFSEPKIPQWSGQHPAEPRTARFSALQRAENSSIWSARRAPTQPATSFSALQRAENSQYRAGRGSAGLNRDVFQCSSASRKFSIQPLRAGGQHVVSNVSVLFSEPKILNINVPTQH